ncbi:MAG: COG4705 family protein [Solirubrobacteraceae bacterium]
MFWVLKLLTTGMGEAMSDFMGQHSVPLAAAVGIFGLAFALWLQLRASAYRAPLYWFAVMMVAVFGTMAADGIHDGVNIPYSITTPAFAAFVAATFLFWYRLEGTLSIHTINTRRRELFYWTAVLGTFALGTAAGDLTAYSLNLGFWPSAALFAVVFAVPGVAWARGRMNPIFAFWFAYVATRPLGASFADGFSKPTNGGLNLGDGTVSAIALIVFIALVAYVTRTRADAQDDGETLLEEIRAGRSGAHPGVPHDRAHAEHPHLQAPHPHLPEPPPLGNVQFDGAEG